MRDDGSDNELADQAADVMRATQALVCDAVEAIESQAGSPARFATRTWDGPRTHGTCRVLLEGAVIEKAGVTTSLAHGVLPPRLAESLRGDGPRFDATRVSIALYPRNPSVPAAHAAFWYIGRGSRRWVGGGCELVPYAVDFELEEHVHKAWRAHCEAFPSVADHRRFREWSEAYYHLPHRGERRGIGGLYFDHLRVDAGRLGHADTLLRFVAETGIRWLALVGWTVERNADKPFSAADRRWQRLRRSRDAEFSLTCDRDPVFGDRASEHAQPLDALLPPEIEWSNIELAIPTETQRDLLDRLRRPVRSRQDFEP